nr:MAG TPA: hypothetical protein [Caudoviricetes sp.]
MILGDKAVTELYKYLNENIESIGIKEGRIFKYEIPEKLSVGDYIAINHLPFVYGDVVNEGVVNLNIHCPKTSFNLPNIKKLSDYSEKILSLFRHSTYLGGCYFDFYSISRPTRDSDNTYYVNMKFNVTYNNLKE